MKEKMYEYLEDGVSFRSSKASELRTIYAPLSGVDSKGIKSAISPYLSGDIKIDKFRYLTKPVSTEDLRNNVRDFFVSIENKKVISLTQDVGKENTNVEVGQLWHKLIKRFEDVGVELEALNFVPVSGENMEIMQVKVTNFSKWPVSIVPTSSVPMFCRALANKQDHEHVTSLLKRTEQMKTGVCVQPPMAFDEQGHRKNSTVYAVIGFDDNEKLPVGSFPTRQSFLGDNGTLDRPGAVYNGKDPLKLDEKQIQGKEAIGALRFDKTQIHSGQSRTYYVLLVIAEDRKELEEIEKNFFSKEKIREAFADNISFWKNKTDSIIVKSGDPFFNSWMKWVTLQPILRRIYGCSFLPDHDYGKGGKGWRDIWQDLLSLILIEPENVRGTLINNFAGVRIDGSNATIIGDKPGEFFADRNAITRVWMDHGIWPFETISLYLEQTGDMDILFENVPYFKDMQMSRTFEKDADWTLDQSDKLQTKNGSIYQGSVIEHILIEHLVQFFNVGEHNITRLESADWNDGLDMAFENGESVAFMSFYGGNLLDIADLLEYIVEEKGIEKIELAEELLILIDTIGDSSIDYDDVHQKKDLLFKGYFKAVQPKISGDKISVPLKDLIKDLRGKGYWIFDHIRTNEKISVDKGGKEYSWFNGYYDNKLKRVEGVKENSVRMTLTGQTFPIISGLADKEDITDIIKSVQRFLKDKKLGGYKLNTDFGVSHYLDLGRAFGFAYGTKENGAFFSHMIVMYAFGLYKRNFVHAGYDVLKSLYDMSIDTDKSKIYPGIPEYMDLEGKGMYHYLTGSASWFVLTELTQVFGVRGSKGDLVICPKLVKEQFANKEEIGVICKFAGRKIEVCYLNPKRLDFGEYKIKDIMINSEHLIFEETSDMAVKINKETVSDWPDEVRLFVSLDKK